MTDDRPYIERWREVPVITTVAEYDGQASIRISATQLGSDYTARATAKVVDEWLEFFEAGPSPIRELDPLPSASAVPGGRRESSLAATHRRDTSSDDNGHC
jgi:hypothetical protein